MSNEKKRQVRGLALWAIDPRKSVEYIPTVGDDLPEGEQPIFILSPLSYEVSLEVEALVQTMLPVSVVNEAKGASALTEQLQAVSTIGGEESIKPPENKDPIQKYYEISAENLRHRQKARELILLNGLRGWKNFRFGSESGPLVPFVGREVTISGEKARLATNKDLEFVPLELQEELRLEIEAMSFPDHRVKKNLETPSSLLSGESSVRDAIGNLSEQGDATQ